MLLRIYMCVWNERVLFCFFFVFSMRSEEQKKGCTIHFVWSVVGFECIVHLVYLFDALGEQCSWVLLRFCKVFWVFFFFILHFVLERFFKSNISFFCFICTLDVVRFKQSRGFVCVVKAMRFADCCRCNTFILLFLHVKHQHSGSISSVAFLISWIALRFDFLLSTYW